MRPVVGLVTIDQSPRVDVVPDMAEIIGPAVDIREAGALDERTRAEIAALALAAGDDVLNLLGHALRVRVRVRVVGDIAGARGGSPWPS